MVDGALRGASLASLFDPGLQSTHVNAIEREATYPGHQSPQAADVVRQAALMLVFQHKLRRGLLKRARGPNTVDLGLACFFHHSCEVSFGFFEAR